MVKLAIIVAISIALSLWLSFYRAWKDELYSDDDE